MAKKTKQGGTDVTTGQGWQPGNDLSAIRDRGKIFTRHINMILREDYLDPKTKKPVKDPSDQSKFLTKARKIANNIVEAALNSEQWAMIWLVEKLEGKTPQKVDHTVVHYNLANLTIDETRELLRLLRKAGVVDIAPEEYVDITPQ